MIAPSLRWINERLFVGPPGEDYQRLNPYARIVADEARIAGRVRELGDEITRARAVRDKRFAELPVSAIDRAKQARFLQSRGFSLDTIIAVLRGRAEDSAHH